MRKWLGALAAVIVAASVAAFAEDQPAAKEAVKPEAKKPEAAKADAAKPEAAPEAGPLKTLKDKASYCIGLLNGNHMKQQGLAAEDVDVDMLAKGMKDSMSGVKPLMTEEQINETLKGFQTEITAKVQVRQKVLGEKNKKEGDAFLAENKAKAGVKTLPDGLQYQVLQEGAGPLPKATDTVVVNYRGTLIDGKEFDSSYKRGEPATFKVDGVIPGWTEAVQLMKVGSKWRVFVPPSLAYGERGAGAIIGPNSTLVFDIELISIKPETKEPPAVLEIPGKSEKSEKPAKPAVTK